MNRIHGKILKGIGGFYYVKTEDGLIECRARGLFRNKDMMPYVGDNVEIELSDDGSGYVVSIDKRKNFFVRPPISNVDLMLIVVALANPSPDLMFLDKMLIWAKERETDVLICFNKSDLADNAKSNPYEELYSSIGYRVITTSTYTGEGIEELKKAISGKVISVSGFSGVGKSSLLNALLTNDELAVGEVSKKLSRGKHTTREVSLIEYTDGSYLADTPGFSSLSLPDSITKDNLKSYFLDFAEFEQDCKFADCLHLGGKFCGVCDACSLSKIAQTRYDNYIKLYNTIKDKKEWK